MTRTLPVVTLAWLLLATTLVSAQDDEKQKETRARIEALLAKVQDLYRAGRYAEAKPLADEAQRVAEESLGPEDSYTAAALSWRGGVLQAMGNLADARPLLQRVLSICEKTLGPDDPGTAAAVNALACLLRDMGDAAGARPLFERALAIREKALGTDHLDTAASLAGLAEVLQAMGERRAAKPLLERALAIREKALGPDHPETASSLHSLASLLHAMGDTKGARPLLERALAIREKALGPEHPMTAASLINLGFLLHAMGDLKGARPLLERALAIDEKVLGPEHPDTASVLNNLAMLLEDMGDFKAARPLLERALAIREKKLGPDHPNTALSLNNLAYTIQVTGDLDGAKRLYERALATREKTLGPDHPDTAQSLNNLAFARYDSGDLKGARSLLERALAIQEKSLGADHPDTARSLNSLAYVLQAMGDIEGARPLFERAQAIWEKSLGPDHPDTATGLNHLALLLQTTGDAKGAVPLFERAWKSNRAFLHSLLPVLSSRERCAAVREKSVQLGKYLSGLSVDPGRTYAALLAWKGATLRADAATMRLPVDATAEARSVAENLAEARRALARLALSPPARKEGEGSIAAQYEGAQKRVEELERRLAELQPEFAKRAFLEVEMPAVREALPEGAALLDTLENCGTMHAWIVRRDGDIAYFNLGKAADLAPLATKFREALEKDDEKQWKEAGGALRKKLEKALSAALAGSKTLYVSPDGVLATIPWGLLPEGDGFLIERLPIVCVSGGGAGLVMAKDTQRNERTEGLLTIGGVDYEKAEGATGKGTRPERQASALPETKQEADQVAKRFSERFPKASLHTLTGGLATVAAFEKLAPSARFVHVATHGYFDTEHLAVALGGATRGFSAPMLSAEAAPTKFTPSEGPQARVEGIGGWNPLLLSGIVLAGANAGDGGGGSDGLLTAEELQGLDLTGTELVVLSACETGRGELAAGEGVLGLSRALFVAGAKGFMLSLWAVPDDDTRELMDGFYDELWCGRGAGTRPARTLEEALRSTQLRMLLRDRERKAFRPSTWGAWVLLR